MSGYQVDGWEQFLTAAIAAAVGGGLCLAYDVLRLLRYIKRPTVVSAFVQDVVWWLIAAAATYLMLLARCSGVVRFFALLGLAVGFVCCRFTLSVMFMKVAKPTADGAKRLFRAIHRRFVRPLCNGCVRITQKCKKTLKNILKSVKNLLKPVGGVVYNQLKSWVGMPCRKRSDDNGAS